MKKKDVFRLVTSWGQRKNSEFPWGIEPLTFGFHTVMLYHGARIGVNQTLRLSESESLRFDCCDITMVIWFVLWCSATELELECGTIGLRFNSSWGLRIFSLSNACDKTKNIFLYFFTELKTYHLSYSFYKLNDTCLLIGSFLWSIGNRCIDDLTIEQFFFSLSYNTNRFHVAMDLFSSRSQKTITCDYNISDTFSFTLFTTFLFLLYFDLNCDLYLNRFIVPWNLFVNNNRVWMSHTWLTCFPPNNFGLLQVSWSLIKELWKKRKNATPKVSCVLVHFALKRKYKLALTSEELCAQCISSGMRL